MKGFLKGLSLIVALSACSDVKSTENNNSNFPIGPMEIKYTSSNMKATNIAPDRLLTYERFEHKEFDGQRSCFEIYNLRDRGSVTKVFDGFNGICDGIVDSIVEVDLVSGDKSTVFCNPPGNYKTWIKCKRVENDFKEIGFWSEAKAFWYEKREDCKSTCEISISDK